VKLGDSGVASRSDCGIPRENKVCCDDGGRAAIRALAEKGLGTPLPSMLLIAGVHAGFRESKCAENKKIFVLNSLGAKS
jgi:hypothetical protein